MTQRSGHRPTARLVPRPPRGAMPDEDLFQAADRREAEEETGQPQPPAGPKPVTIQERFDVWIAANPLVLDTFIRLAREAKARGKDRIGAKLLCEVIRWEMWINSDVPEDDDFKLNNVYTSRLSRLAVQAAPDIADMFQFRQLKSA